MSGPRRTATSCLNRRRPLKPNRLILHCWKLLFIVMACALFGATIAVRPAFGQAAQGPVRITLDEAIQMALQHNHTLLAARTTIAQNEALEVTANLRPNPFLFGDWDYLPFFTPSQW